jgi:hypothetical protein
MELLGSQIRADFNLKGRMTYSMNRQGIKTFTYFRPGNISTAQLNTEGNKIEILHRQSISAIRLAKGTHTMRKFGGGIAYFVWGIFLDLTAISFIIFPITGIVIWFQNRKVFAAGWILLLSGFAITCFVIVMLWF